MTEKIKIRSSEKIDAQILGNKTDEKQKEKKEEGKKIGGERKKEGNGKERKNKQN